MRAVNHVRLEQLQVSDVLVAAFELTHILDVLQFEGDEGAVRVAVPMHERQHAVAVFPAVLAREPARRFWQPHHGEEETDRRDHLEGPGDTEGGRVVVG